MKKRILFPLLLGTLFTILPNQFCFPAQATAKIKLYTYPKCPYCEKVITFLKNNGVYDQVTIINANNPKHYTALKEISRKDICPYLHDEVNNHKMGESSRIIQYFKNLFKL